ncbi:hypothetical protein C0J52_08667 [Blattella germanica]|nr:hypothetical protein C0J52_08667 [Blattella germanica]
MRQYSAYSSQVQPAELWQHSSVMDGSADRRRLPLRFLRKTRASTTLRKGYSMDLDISIDRVLVGDSAMNNKVMMFKRHTKPASPEAMRQGSKAPRLDITIIPTVTNVLILQTMNPRYLGSASSSTRT